LDVVLLSIIWVGFTVFGWRHRLFQWADFVAQIFIEKQAILWAFRAFDWLSSVSGAKNMSQKRKLIDYSLNPRSLRMPMHWCFFEWLIFPRAWWQWPVKKFRIFNIAKKHCQKSYGKKIWQTSFCWNLIVLKLIKVLSEKTMSPSRYVFGLLFSLHLYLFLDSAATKQLTFAIFRYIFKVLVHASTIRFIIIAHLCKIFASTSTLTVFHCYA